MDIRKVCLIAVAVFGACFTGVAATGDCYKNAASISIGGTKTVKLVDEKNLDYDPEFDDPVDKTYGEGAYYLSFTVSRGKAYTVTIKRSTPESEISTEIGDKTSFDWESEDWISWPGFSSETDPDGLTDRFILYAEDWTMPDPEYDDPGDDKSVKCYIAITGGLIGETVTVKVENGVVEYTPPLGTEARPDSISVASELRSKSATLVDDNSYYFMTQELKKGRKYKFWTSGGTEEQMLDLYVAGAEEVEDPAWFDLEDWKDKDDYNAGGVVLIKQTGVHMVVVQGDSYGQPFALNYQLVPARKPSAHAAVALSPTTNGTSAECDPGRRNDPASGYFDDVIDSALYRFSLKKGKYYAFETEGASVPLTMELYDSSGKVVLSNSRAFAEGHDCKIVFKAPKDATYWVGVCQQLEDDENDELANSPCTFTVTRISEGVSDEWDSADDSRDCASVLSPVISASWKSDAAGHGPHTFGALDWKDVYALNARKGLTYKIGAICADEKYAQALTLAARIYKGSSEEPVATVDNLASGGNFKAGANAVYYIEVYVAEGQGVDYCEHTIHAAVSGAENLGTLNVDFGGATVAEGAGWYFTSEKVNYLPGAIVVPAGDEYKVSFANVDGWTRPKGESGVVVAVGETTEIFKKYSDDHDASDLAYDATLGDGHYNGEKATTLTPTAKKQTVSRSLWKEDAQDWFRFKTVANAYYTISLVDDGKLGDATITLLTKNAAAGKLEEIAGGRDITLLSKTAGAWWRPVIEHLDPGNPQDSQYTMTYSYIQVGAIGFEESAKSVKDSSSAAKLTVARTGGKSGRVRVRYRTQSGTDYDSAKPGEHYLPTNGYLVWEDGDDEPKTISVPLLPQLRPEWDETRSFTVELAALAPEELDDDELVPVVSTSVAEVTIKPANKMACGVLEFMGVGDVEDEISKFGSSPKFSVPADESVTVWVSRAGGKDGSVAAIVTTRDSSAKEDVDYEPFEERLVWENGDDKPKCVVLNTYYAGDPDTYQAVRKMTLRLAVDEEAQYEAKLGDAEKVVVSIVDPYALGTFSDYQSVCEKMTGISVVQDGEWYFDSFGDLRNVTPTYKDTSSLVFTVDGPGVFAFTPEFDDGGDSRNVAKYKIDAESWVTINGERVERYFEAGEHTVTIRVWRKTEDLDGQVSLALWPEEEGLPVLWKPLRAPEAVAPLKGEVLNPAAAVLVWKDFEDLDITYRVSLATSKSRLDSESKALVYREDPGGASYDLSGLGLDYGATYYWRVDAVMTDDDGEEVLVAEGDVQSFKTVAAPVAGDAPLALSFAGSAVEKYGISGPEESGLPFEAELTVGVDANVGLTVSNATEDAEFTYALVDEDNYPLPPGMSLSKKGAIVRYPTKAGAYTTLLKVTQEANGVKTVGETLKVTFNVKKLSLAAGTFNGLVATEDDRVYGCTEDGLAASTFGSLKVTVDSTPYSYGNSSSKNNIVASFSIGGKSHKFTAKSWSESVTLENGQPGVKLELEEDETIEYDGGKKTKKVTNRLELTACTGSSGDWTALDTPMTAKLTLSVPRMNGKSVVTNAVWEGVAMRNNSAGSLVKSELAKFEGYYTVSLAPNGTDAGDETGAGGNGFVTLTIDKKGGVKYVTFLADGSVDHAADDKSRSATAAFLSSATNGVEGGELVIPLYYAKSTWAFGGWLRLKTDGSVAVVNDNQEGEICSMPLKWINAVADSTYVAGGFDLNLSPVGGYYDSVVNLQRHYYNLGYTLAMSGDDFSSFADDFMGYKLGDDYLLAYPGMNQDGFDGTIAVGPYKNKLQVEDRELVYRDSETKMIDWFASVNPCNVKLSSSRATGIYSGSFQLFSGNSDVPGEETVKTKIATPYFKGVLLLSRDPETAVIDEDVVAPGAIYTSVKSNDDDPRTVKVSAPFAIRAVEIEKPWTEDGWEEDYPEFDE